MAFLGLYTEKEVKKVKEMAKEFGRLQGRQEATTKYMKEKHELENRIKVLSDLLVLEVDKDSVKLEKIAKRTKKFRIKKKCESEILRNRMKRLAYERC